jgi:hypothetical protein
VLGSVLQISQALLTILVYKPEQTFVKSMPFSLSTVVWLSGEVWRKGKERRERGGEV